MTLIITNELILKINDLLRHIGNMQKIFIFFQKYHPLHQVNVLAHLLCHVTYVTDLK